MPSRTNAEQDPNPNICQQIDWSGTPDFLIEAQQVRRQLMGEDCEFRQRCPYPRAVAGRRRLAGAVQRALSGRIDLPAEGKPAEASPLAASEQVLDRRLVEMLQRGERRLARQNLLWRSVQPRSLQVVARILHHLADKTRRFLRMRRKMRKEGQQHRLHTTQPALQQIEFCHRTPPLPTNWSAEKAATPERTTP